MNLQDTGERHIITESFSNKAELYNHLMHLATYRFAERYAINKRVLDFGCGSGYGSYELSKVAATVTAVDVSCEAIEYARSRFKNPNLTYLHIDQIGDEKYDIITSFQVIEHVDNVKTYLQQLKRLLSDDGTLIITTPDKSIRLFDLIQRPWNVYHVKEYKTDELNKLLSGYFTKIELLKIGSDKDFVDNEIVRYRKQRIVTLPCTLIIYPLFFRNWLLKCQSSMYNLFQKLRCGFRKKPIIEVETVNFTDDYVVDDIKFENHLTKSTDIMAICRNQQ